ncbi:hypothetical protein MASR2M78_11580 [Treponema sp.]
MRELTDSDHLSLERLDVVEARLMDFDRARAKNGDWRVLVHELFREVHNLKSAFAMAGHEGSSRIAHELESRLDELRTGREIPSASWTDALLGAVDAARESLALGLELYDPQVELAIAVLQSLVQKKAESLTPTESKEPPLSKGPAIELDFSLSGEEAELLRIALVKGASPYILEKLVGTSLSPEDIARLPILESIAEVGSVIAWRTKPAGTAGLVLSVLFLSAIDKAELGYSLFDPFYAVSVPPVAAPAEPPISPEKIPRVLIVDDEVLVLLILQNYLASFARVDTAIRGQEALDKFEEALAGEAYDVLFLDIMMPDMDGHKTLKKLREAEKKAGILDGTGCRVIMASALSDFSTISTSFRELCDAYLVKPFDRTAVEGAMIKLGFEKINLDKSRIMPRRRD